MDREGWVDEWIHLFVIDVDGAREFLEAGMMPIARRTDLTDEEFMVEAHATGIRLLDEFLNPA
ncbi:MAG: hypothetical protein AAF581_06625 [Planctomycetota bacterium]